MVFGSKLNPYDICVAKTNFQQKTNYKSVSCGWHEIISLVSSTNCDIHLMVETGIRNERIYQVWGWQNKGAKKTEKGRQGTPVPPWEKDTLKCL